jgi:hypothetical protein
VAARRERRKRKTKRRRRRRRRRRRKRSRRRKRRRERRRRRTRRGRRRKRVMWGVVRHRRRMSIAGVMVEVSVFAVVVLFRDLLVVPRFSCSSYKYLFLGLHYTFHTSLFPSHLGLALGVAGPTVLHVAVLLVRWSRLPVHHPPSCPQ